MDLRSVTGRARFATATVISDELDHIVEPEALARVTDLVEKFGARRMGGSAARRHVRKLLRALGLAREADEVLADREKGVWFEPHLDIDSLTEMRVVLDTGDALALHAVIEARAEHLRAGWGGGGLPPSRGRCRVDALVDLMLENSSVHAAFTLQVPLAADSPPTQSLRREQCSTMRFVRALRSSPGESSAFADVDVPGMGVVTGEALARLAASIGTTFAVRLTRDLANGRVVTTGTLSQTYRPHATMAALVTDRDEVCRFPYGTRPGASADLDHVIPFAEGGATSGSNLQSLCRHHHRAKTFGGYAVSMDAEATCEWESPTGRRWLTRPGGATVPLEPRAGRVA